MLIGLAAKNGILIVEFAVQRRAEGLAPIDAVIAAAQTRLRPILMTSIAFIAGLMPWSSHLAPVRRAGTPSAPPSSAA
jgi:multidrug efflux pump subunit AcrB